jgi:hypothetical protein
MERFLPFHGAKLSSTSSLSALSAPPRETFFSYHAEPQIRRVNVPNRGALAPFAGHLPADGERLHLSFLLTPRPPRASA